jgi:hypothetical protein
MSSRYTEREHKFWRPLVVCEEDRWKYPTKAPWRGGYRWFRSPNVVPLEQWRRDVVEPVKRGIIRHPISGPFSTLKHPIV